MKTRRTLNLWGPTSLAVLLAATLGAPVYAQEATEQPPQVATPGLDADALASAEQVSAQRELPRGHFRLPEEGDIVGQYYTVTVDDPEETLLDIARRHNIGYEEIRMANPDVSLWVPGEGTEVIIPAQYILPPAERKGIVVNLSELRLYYYPENSPGIVETYPVSVGREEFATPVGMTQTTVKVKDPAWAPPASMRREAAERGDPAPEIVPAGPDNPLGRHAILLGMPSYLIHGTNRPDGVGMRVSRGCIRMYPEDIESLYERVPSGTQVNLMDAPFKAGWGADGTLYVQSYPQLEENVGDFEPLLNAIERVESLTDEELEIDYEQVKRAVESPNGRFVALYGPQAQAPAPESPAEKAPSERQGLFEDIELSATVESDSDA
ncbi:L,D-transpeptidase family protein [Halomonas sp. PAMB 3264]|uniref:L,D-transpeptidase family protein n=1 Tax=unclassified Halomonas TaxID=2609666 RepID=UPI0028A023A5|nr:MULTISPECIES: L,D-transpeptidase family protein [unclassified Halomonas]WNL37602.1 L,D-transpeptidase family protein [Halomonas sp. PAMB 3232]WNL40916.1 L,D-transpeptidase family protein [Halomonas sp. PAMB 3264]